MLVLTSYKKAQEIADPEIFTNVCSIYDKQTTLCLPNVYQNYLALEMDDDLTISQNQVMPFFPWLEKAKQNKGHTLIHCYMGVSRSVAFSLIFLVEHGYSVNEAIEYVKNNCRFGEEDRIGPCPNLKILEYYGNKELMNNCYFNLPLFRENYPDYIIH